MEGLDHAVGAGIYTDEHGERRIAILTPETEALHFLFDGLEVAGMQELKRLVDAGREHEQRRYPDDAGMQLAYECLGDRHGGHDEIAALMDAYEGDFWFDFFGPLFDRIEEAIGVPEDSLPYAHG